MSFPNGKIQKTEGICRDDFCCFLRVSKKQIQDEFLLSAEGFHSGTCYMFLWLLHFGIASVGTVVLHAAQEAPLWSGTGTHEGQGLKRLKRIHMHTASPRTAARALCEVVVQ